MSDAAKIEGSRTAGAASQQRPRQQSDDPAGRNARPGENAAAALVKLEGQLRLVRAMPELTYLVANEFRAFTRAQQIYVVRKMAGSKVRVEAVSALTFVDRSSPVIVELENLIAGLAARHGLAKPRELDLDASGLLMRSYPLANLLWVPFLDLKGEVLGGMLQARSTPWSSPDITISSHLASAASFAWLALEPPARRWQLGHLASRKIAAIATAVTVAAMFIPVSMSALAPVEVAPKNAFIVTAGVDGVVEHVEIEPNAHVIKGQPLVRLTDTVFRNRFEVAEREVTVAEAQQKKAAQLAFVDVRGRQDLAIAQSELALKVAERDFARDLLMRATVKAERDGVAFFTDKKDLVGRPVAAGEKLMEIVDPASLQFNVSLPAADAIVLKNDARVKVFLDSDPLNPIEAVVVRADYRAYVRDAQLLSFRVVAEPAPGMANRLRLGVRGTAQVYSDRTLLIFYLLRRPLASARQMLGL